MTRIVHGLSLSSLAMMTGCSSIDPFAMPDRSGCTLHEVADTDLDGQTDYEWLTVYGPEEVVLRSETLNLQSNDSTVVQREVDNNGCSLSRIETVVYGERGTTSRSHYAATCDELGYAVSAVETRVRLDAEGQETDRWVYNATFSNEYDDRDLRVSQHIRWVVADTGEEMVSRSYTWAYDAQGRQIAGSKIQDDELIHDFQAEWHNDTNIAWRTYLTPEGSKFSFNADFDEHDRPIRLAWTGDYEIPETRELAWSDTRYALTSVRYDWMNDGETDLVATYECEEGVPVMACSVSLDGHYTNTTGDVDDVPDITREWRYTCP
jgi:hypothetical protein